MHPETDYRTRILNEEKFYQDSVTVHDLPEIYHYWSEKYLLPKLQAAGFASIPAMFSGSLAAACVRRNPDQARFLSIGAGNCDVEIDLAQTLRAVGHTNFVIDCLELNPAMLQRGTEAAAERGVSPNIAPLQADFNTWQSAAEYDAVLANQALHHVLNLEGLFDQIKASLRPDGCFVISDMIGRNGHLRWPEALTIVHEYWRKLPLSHRFNWQLKRYEAMFEDFDCSRYGFEGVRAQDILPLLLERFHFSTFVAFGNVIDPFVDRSFGHNFRIADEWDRAFIDEVHARDEAEMARGNLTPTHMFAVVDLKNEPNPAHALASVRHGEPIDAAPEPATPPQGHLERMIHELEAERRRLEGVVLDKSKEVQVLLDDLAARTEWAWSMERELKERTNWALTLDRQLAKLTERITGKR